MRKGKKFHEKKYWKYALNFNLPLVPHFLSQVILNHSDRIMIKELVGYSEAGIYSLAYSLAMILTMLNTSIQNALRPWIFQRLKANESEKIEPVGIGALAIVGLCNLALISFAPELIAFFSPASYSTAAVLIPPITMGVFFAFMYNLFVDIQMYFEKTKSIMIVAIICATVNIITNYMFISKFGYVAAAYTTLFSYMLMTLLHYYGMKRSLKRNGKTIKIYNTKKIILITVVFIGLGTIMGLLENYLIIRLTIVIIIATLVFIKRRTIISLINTVFKSKESKGKA